MTNKYFIISLQLLLMIIAILSYYFVYDQAYHWIDVPVLHDSILVQSINRGGENNVLSFAIIGSISTYCVVLISIRKNSRSRSPRDLR
jgi:hypothetical protein